MKKEVFISLITIIIILVVTLGSIIVYAIRLSVRVNESDSIICLVESSADDSYMEFQFDFYEGKLYKYTLITESDFEMTNQAFAYYVQKMEENEEKISGYNAKVEVENGRMRSIESTDFNLMPDDKIIEFTLASKEQWQSMTKQEIKDSLIVFGGTVTCN